MGIFLDFCNFSSCQVSPWALPSASLCSLNMICSVLFNECCDYKVRNSCNGLVVEGVLFHIKLLLGPGKVVIVWWLAYLRLVPRVSPSAESRCRQQGRTTWAEGVAAVEKRQVYLIQPGTCGRSSGFPLPLLRCCRTFQCTGSPGDPCSCTARSCFRQHETAARDNRTALGRAGSPLKEFLQYHTVLSALLNPDDGRKSVALPSGLYNLWPSLIHSLPGKHQSIL